ncbi:hypothetical protein ACFUEJ_21260, partial [Gordonia sp. NPDC057258]|uniref:hypothetical protein n=1 Tax=unclassified Gordonia (in: high G+C Gram-positive bacteria) TaxID=2657482 RepID=UPI00362F1329
VIAWALSSGSTRRTQGGDFYLATSGDLDLATNGDFLMAMDRRATLYSSVMATRDLAEEAGVVVAL